MESIVYELFARHQHNNVLFGIQKYLNKHTKNVWAISTCKAFLYIVETALWEDHETDMVLLSKALPEIYFVLHCDADRGVSEEVYLNGVTSTFDEDTPEWEERHKLQDDKEIKRDKTEEDLTIALFVESLPAKYGGITASDVKETLLRLVVEKMKKKRRRR